MRVGIAKLAASEVLASRDRGASAAAAVSSYIEKEISALPPGTPIALDFEDIEAITVPFAQECFGRLLGNRIAGRWSDYPFCIVNANEDVRATVALALAQRDLFVLSLGESVELLGGNAAMNQTVETAISTADTSGQFSVNELAERLDVSVQAVNNRLKPLLRNGVLSRTQTTPPRGGREYVYRVPRRESAIAT